MAIKGEKSNEKVFTVIVLSSMLAISIYGRAISTARTNNLRRQLDSTRELLLQSEDTSRELRGRIECSQEILREIGTTADRDITTVRDCIEIVEQLRCQIEDLENILYSSDTDDVYDRIDNWLESEGVKIE